LGQNRTISFLVTTACENQCRFCFERGSANAAILPADFVLAKVRERKPMAVDIAGGEPLLHPEFRIMADGIRKAGARLTVTTNGLALADAGLAEFLANTANRIVLSVHAGTPEDYAHVTGNQEGFSLLRKALSNLSKHVAKGQVLVNSTVTAQTWPAISAVPKLTAPIDPLAWHVTNPMPLGAAARDFAAIVPRIAQVRSGIDQVVQAARQQGMDVFFGFFPACALGEHRRFNSDMVEPGQARGFQVDRDLNPHQTQDLVFERRFAEPCQDCRLARTACAGPSAEYLRLFGSDELVAVTEADTSRSSGDRSHRRAGSNAPTSGRPDERD